MIVSFDDSSAAKIESTVSIHVRLRPRLRTATRGHHHQVCATMDEKGT